MTADKSQQLLSYLADQGILTNFVKGKHSFFDPKDEVDGSVIASIPFSKQTNSRVGITDSGAESMSLASMYAVLQLSVVDADRILDTCAAPGMKGMYLNALADIDYYANDVSGDRIARMNRLYDKHTVKVANLTKYDARFINRAYDTEFFDKILIDAPCSGEGVALGGDDKLLAAWSPAKVKRLQQLQIKIVKSAWELIRPGGRLVYATCTLNKNENERVIKKALGVSLSVAQRVLLPLPQDALENGHAVRILPSLDSIGFFIAVVHKPESDGNDQI